MGGSVGRKLTTTMMITAGGHSRVVSRHFFLLPSPSHSHYRHKYQWASPLVRSSLTLLKWRGVCVFLCVCVTKHALTYKLIGVENQGIGRKVGCDLSGTDKQDSNAFTWERSNTACKRVMQKSEVGKDGQWKFTDRDPCQCQSPSRVGWLWHWGLEPLEGTG